MATVRERGQSWEVAVRRSCLPRTHYATFDTEAEARAYGLQIEALIDAGKTPPELLVVDGVQEARRVAVDDYLK